MQERLDQIAEWVRLTEEKVAQSEPPGGEVSFGPTWAETLKAGPFGGKEAKLRQLDAVLFNRGRNLRPLVGWSGHRRKIPLHIF